MGIRGSVQTAIVGLALGAAGIAGAAAPAKGNGQGPLLQATHIDGFVADPKTARDPTRGMPCAVTLDRAEIVATCGGTTYRGRNVPMLELDGTSGGSKIRVQIAANAVQHGYLPWDPSGSASVVAIAGAWEYSVVYFPPGSGAPKDLCVNKPNRALPVLGAWSASSGTHTPDPDQWTFSCLDGAVTKCIDWGYTPWPHPSVASMEGYHQACTRMARADYCGDGQTHTVEGTIINYHDLVTPSPLNGDTHDPATFKLEAAWVPGAQKGVVCLSRLRWQTLPLGGYCPAKLRDPRTMSGGGDAYYCDNPALKTLTDIQNHWSKPANGGALLFNFSTINDVPLQRRTAGKDQITFAGPILTGSTSVFEGSLYSPSAPYLPTAATVKLSSYSSGSETLTTTAAYPPPVGYSGAALLGYLFPPGTSAPALPGKARRLYRHYNPTTKDYWTTTAASPPAASGYTKSVVLGWLPR